MWGTDLHESVGSTTSARSYMLVTIYTNEHCAVIIIMWFYATFNEPPISLGSILVFQDSFSNSSTLSLNFNSFLYFFCFCTLRSFPLLSCPNAVGVHVPTCRNNLGALYGSQWITVILRFTGYHLSKMSHAFCPCPSFHAVPHESGSMGNSELWHYQQVLVRMVREEYSTNADT